MCAYASETGCVCVCLCQSTYKRVKLCNCGCPFKGPSQICPGPFDQAFYDSTALEMGGCVPGGRRGCLDRDETVDLTHTFTRSHTNRMSAASFKCDASRLSKSTADAVLNNADVCACMCVCVCYCIFFYVF